MPAVEVTPCSRRLRAHALRLAASCLLVMAGAAALVACADEVQDVVLSELAIGSWACAPTTGGTPADRFTVRIDDGTFLVSAPAPGGSSQTDPELSGTWTITGGDLVWELELDRQDAGPVTVEGFEALTLDSRELTLTDAGIFEANDGTDDPSDEQEVLVDAEGTDSVTLTVPGGTPWTCARQ